MTYILITKNILAHSRFHPSVRTNKTHFFATFIYAIKIHFDFLSIIYSNHLSLHLLHSL